MCSVKLTKLQTSRLKRLYSKFLYDQSGQAVVEYILLLSLIAVFIITFLKTMFGVVRNGMLRVNAQVEADLVTGEGYRSVGSWRN